ncbi:RNA polymerase sigma factor RpoE [Raoultella terrigena]|uniref:RNA polymerase sigma factor RpoE n=1 Tax=Raoultella terrigena TaxID=577 RepID=A0A4U9CSZ3_RAOTE|nr:RNA polymerase sigma factor RpoE [Raoultella terrigena]
MENVAAWLFRAARNEMTDRARKKRELPLADYFSGDEEGEFPEDELAETLFGVPQTPEDEYLKELLWEELNQALAELPRRPAGGLRKDRAAGLQLQRAGRRVRGQRAGPAIAQA